MKSESNLYLEHFMYYALIVLSVLMFGGGFALQDEYRKLRGSGITASLEASFIGAPAGFVVLLAFIGTLILFIIPI